MNNTNPMMEGEAYRVDDVEPQSTSWQWPSLTSLLRYAGAFFVAASGIIYLLQGLADANVEMRNWAYLAFMLVLTAGGVLSYKAMHDDKGARLFFGLATLLVPIQFTQLGAMVYEWANPVLNQAELLSLNQLLIFSGLSLVMGIFSTFGGLSILARPYAKKLTIYFLLFNAALILPERQLLPTLLVSTAMTVIFYLLNVTIFKRDQRFNLIEGQAVKAMLAVPLMIIVARSGFHINDQFGIGLMILEATFFTQMLTASFKSAAKVNVVLNALGLALFVIGWISVADTLFTDYRAIFRVPTDFDALVILLPILLMTARLDLKSAQSTHYRVVGSIVFVLYGFMTWFSADLYALSILSLVAVAVLLYAVKQHSKSLLTVSSIYLVLSLARILWDSIGHIDLNAWLVFAIAGVTLVTISTVIERYGYTVKSRLTNSLSSLKQWEY